VVGGVVPTRYIPAIEKGLREAVVSGPLTGYPVVDLKAAVYDGSHHPVDSSEVAFKIAAGLAFRAAIEKAKPMLLEPFVTVEVHAPEQYTGEIVGDISSRRGKNSRYGGGCADADCEGPDARSRNARLPSRTYATDAEPGAILILLQSL